MRSNQSVFVAETRHQQNHAENLFDIHINTSQNLFYKADALREENIFLGGELSDFLELVAID